jgi:SAM-dependent methyltransferase
MFDFINKREYFRWGDQGIPLGADKGLKGAQDAFILSLLSGKSGLRILAMGGGNSRMLRVLSAENECWSVEEVGGGQIPESPNRIAKVRHITGSLGDFSPEFPDTYFDYVVSIAVVGHAPKGRLLDLFGDCWRLLKPGGTMAHTMDVYLLDQDQQNHPHQASVQDRLALYRQGARGAGFELLEPSSIDNSPSYRCSYVSHPDSLMFMWNQRAPQLRPLREIAQAVSLKAIWRKPPE